MAIDLNTSLSTMFTSQLYGSMSTSSSAFDYAAAKQQAEEALAQYEAQTESVTSLKTDAADFLSTYTKKMTSMQSSAKAVSGINLDKLLGDIEDGKISDENLENLVDAVQTMVDDYNSALTTLNDNADRGSGVSRQIGRMVQAPTSENSMEKVGVTMNDDGTLSLDTDKLKEAFTEAAEADALVGDTARVDLLKDILGGSSGIAAGIRSDAENGLNLSGSSLIGNDLAEIQSASTNNTYSLMNLYAKSGSMNLMNMAAVTSLMNITV